jgi:Flp pilus assembly protein TadG
MFRNFRRATSASAAVEFALLAPVLILFMFGTLCFSLMFSIASSVQQLAAESARASVAGLSDSERAALVQKFIAANIGAYPFLEAQQLTVTTTSVTTPAPAFQVALTYDLTPQVAAFAALVPLPTKQVHGTAVVLTSSSL